MSDRGPRRRATRPPLPERLLRLILPAGPTGASVLGDLREEHARRVARGRPAAALWYWRAALSVAAWRVSRHFSRARFEPSPSFGDRLADGSGLSTAKHVVVASLRSVRRSPKLALAVATIFAVGLGANVTIFGIVDRLLLSPPDGIEDAATVRRLLVERPNVAAGMQTVSASLTYPDFEEFRKLAAFTDVAAYTSAFRLTMGHGEDAEQIRAKSASPGFFELLGVRPILGRVFTEADAAADAEPTVVLTEHFWRRTFDRDPNVLGRRLYIGEGTYTVVGVVPAGFIGVDLTPADVFLEFSARAAIEMGTTEWRTSRNWWWVLAVARLAPGVDATAGEAAATSRYRAARPSRDVARHRIVSASLVLADSPQAPAELEVTRWLGGVSALVLIIACANVANLLLARATRRRRELAVQRALGMSDRRLVGQVLTESLLLAAVGGAASLLVAQWGGAALRSELFPQIDFQSVVYTGRTLGFTAAAVLLATCVAGLSPALRSLHGDVAQTLKDGARGATSYRPVLRSGFVAVQAGLTVVLLVGASLFVRSFRSAADVDLGFDSNVLYTASLEFDGDPPREREVEVYYDAVGAAERLPWVTAATFTAAGPFQGSLQVRLQAEGWDSLPQVPGGGPYAYPVAADYFETLGIDVLRGRPLTTLDDREDSPRVVAVNETMANTLWPDGDALGRCLFVREGPCSEVVAVVANHAIGDLVEEASMAFYVPFRQGLNQPASTLIVRAVTPGDASLPSLTSALSAVSDEVRWVRVRSYTEILEPEVRSWRLGATVFTGFGLLAALVATLGLYSALAHEVADKQRELGIPSALGAPAERLVGRVLSHTAGATSIGVAAGVALSLPFARGLEGLLFGVSANDVASYGAAATAVTLLGLVAAAVPSWRAARADPLVALRSE